MMSQTFSSVGSNYCKYKNFQNANYSTGLLKNLNAHRLSTQLCDVVLISGIDKERVQAHRIILSSFLPYFEAMFSGSFSEIDKREIVLEEFHGHALKAIVDYCYTGEIQLSQTNVDTILAAANLLQINDVEDACFDFFRINLNPSNCLGVAIYAEQRSYHKLKNISMLYSFQNFAEVYKNEEFRQLNVEQIASFLKTDEINVQTEDDVFHALETWIKHDFENRKNHIEELIRMIRLPLLSSSCISNELKALCESSNCFHLAWEALECKLIPESSNRITSRKGVLLVAEQLLMVGISDDNLTIQSYCPRSEKLHLMKKFSNREFDKKFCRRLGNTVLLNTVERWDPNTDKWSYINPMRFARVNSAVAVLNNHLYVCGGVRDWQFLKSVEKYNPQTNTWTDCTPMNNDRHRLDVCALNGFLYAVGAVVDMKVMEIYDPASDTWTEIGPLTLFGRQYHSMAVLDNELFAVDRNSNFYKYDVRRNAWKRKKSMDEKFVKLSIFAPN